MVGIITMSIVILVMGMDMDTIDRVIQFIHTQIMVVLLVLPTMNTVMLSKVLVTNNGKPRKTLLECVRCLHDIAKLLTASIARKLAPLNGVEIVKVIL